MKKEKERQSSKYSENIQAKPEVETENAKH